MNIEFKKYNRLYGIDYYNCPYYVIYYYSDHLIYVKDENNKSFYIDADNNKLNICSNYNLAFENGGALVNVSDNEYGSKIAVINKNAEYIIEPSSWHISRTKTGYVASDEGKKLNFYDFEGTLLNSMQLCFISDYELEHSFLTNGIGNIRKNFLSGLVNSRGEIVQPIKNKHRFQISPDCNFIEIPDNNLKSIYHVYDSKGDFIGSYNTKINKKKYIYINEKTKKLAKKDYKIESNFTHLALVSRDNRYGYIDKDYNVVIPIIYEHASHFINGYACVDDKIINTKGETVYDLKKYVVDFNKFEDKTIWKVVGNLFILDFNRINSKYLVFQTNQKIDKYFRDGNHIYFMLNGKWGIMDLDGNVILNADYTNCKLLEDGKLFWVGVDDEEYILNQQKDKILNGKNYVSILDNNMILFREDNFKGVMYFSGNIILDPLFESIIYSNGKFILDGKILKSLPKRNSSYYHVSYNLDLTIDDKTITKFFNSCDDRNKYINYLNEEKEKIEIELNQQQNRIKKDLEIQLNNLEIEAKQKLIRRC